MKKEMYRNAEMDIVRFDMNDAIITSGIEEPTPTPTPEPTRPPVPVY